MNPARSSKLFTSQPTLGWKTFVTISAGILVVSGIFTANGSKRISSNSRPSLGSAPSLARVTKNPGTITTLASLPPEAQSSLSAALGRDLPGYQTRALRGSVETTNSRQKLTVSFTDRAVELRRGRESWRIAFLSFGYGDALKPAVETAPTANSNRVQYQRGALTEWYVNGPVGLEQGFTVQNRPGLSNGQPLTIALALEGSLVAVVDAGKTALTLNDPEGHAQLHYSGLSAHDATGRNLPAWLEIKDAQLLLKTDDAQARYPVVIDPFVQSAELTASDGAVNEELGASVSVSGNTVVAGAPGCSGCGFVGAAYVFTMPANGWSNMTQTAKLTASDGTTNNQFGFAVSIDGNTIAIGSHAENKSRGAVYVFVEPSGGWTDMTETAKLTGSDSKSGDLLGRSVSISGGTVVAGAPQATVGTVKDQGAAYLFVEPFAGWANATETAKLTASGGVKWGQLGYSVDIDGNTVVAGAPSPVPQRVASAGVAYLFVEPPSGWVSMTQTAALTGSDTKLGDRLANYVAVSGNTVVAGAPLATPGSKQQQGAAYVFVEPFAGWANATQTAKLTSSDGVRGGYFGRSVSISGNQIVVGAPNQTVGSNPGEGAVYEFDEPANGWTDMTQTAELDVSPGAQYDLVGGRVSINNGTVVTGALGENKKGMAFLFTDVE
jgi:hypothetical protein